MCDHLNENAFDKVYKRFAIGLEFTNSNAHQRFAQINQKFLFAFLSSTVPPAFHAQTLPRNKQRKKEDESVSYSCTSEAKPAAKIQWTLNGQSLANLPPYAISSQILPMPGSKLLKTIGYLVIDKLSKKQTGKFSCIAINDAGRAIQSTELELEVPCKYLNLQNKIQYNNNTN